MKFHQVVVAGCVAALSLLGGACVPEPPAPVDPWVAAEGCYTYFGSDIQFTGQVNVFGNAGHRTSSDGSCSGALEDGIWGTNTFVEATDAADASALCNSLDPGPTVYVAFQIANLYVPAFPVSDMWSCIG